MAFFFGHRSPSISGTLRNGAPLPKPTFIEEALRREYVRQTNVSNFTCLINECSIPFPNAEIWKNHIKIQHPNVFQYLTVGSSSYCQRHTIRSPLELSQIARTIKERNASCGKDLVPLGYSCDVIADVLVDNARNIWSSERYSDMQQEAITYYSTHSELLHIKHDSPDARESLEPYFQFFNKLFFFNKLQPPQCTWEFMVPEDSHFADENIGGYTMDYHECSPTEVPAVPIFIQNRRKIRMRVKSSLLHEMIHSFFILHCCKCKPLCHRDYRQTLGKTAHGLAWLRAASAIVEGWRILKTSTLR